jgi:hypothetical protein
MRKNYFLLIIFTIVQLLFFFLDGRCCTIFMCHRDGQTLVANNEDYFWKANIWFNPGKKGEYGRITFGWDNGWSQGGMNECGLFFDWAATSQQPWSYSNDRSPYTGLVVRGNPQICETMLATCSSIDEAINLFQTINVPDLEQSHLMVVDSTGASAIIEWGNNDVAVIYRNGDYQVCTNFNLTSTQDLSKVTWRYHTATNYMKNLEELTPDYFRRALQAVSLDITVYSNLYDIQSRKIYVYDHANFEECLVLDLNQELKLGYRAFKVEDLFCGIKMKQPAAGERLESNNVMFSWLGKPAHYQIQYSLCPYLGQYNTLNADFSGEGSICLFNIQVENLVPDTIYNWRISGYRVTGFCTSTIPRPFTTGNGNIGIKDHYSASYRIYPNPSSGLVYVSLPSPGSYLIICYDNSGSVVSSEYLLESGIVDLSDLFSGVYHIVIWVNGLPVHSDKLVIYKTASGMTFHWTLFMILLTGCSKGSDLAGEFGGVRIALWSQLQIFFVTWLKKSAIYKVLEENRKHYPKSFDSAAEEAAFLYKKRCGIELLFKKSDKIESK